MGWIDQNVLDIIDYFNNMWGTYLRYAISLARILFLLSLIWGGIQMAFGTMEGRKFITQNVTRMFAFLLILSVFPAFCTGLKNFALHLSDDLSGTSIEKNAVTLGRFYAHLRSEVNSLISGEKQEQADYINLVRNLEKTKLEILNQIEREDYGLQEGMPWDPSLKDMQVRDLDYEIDSYNKKIAKLNQKINNLQENNKYYKILNSLQEVLSITPRYDLEGNLSVYEELVNDYNNGVNLTDRYNVSLRLSSGTKETDLLSPSAMVKVLLLGAEIMYTKTFVGDSYATKGIGLFGSNLNIQQIITVILAMVTMIFMGFVAATVCIQYVMAVIEYEITTGFSMVLLPCLLFDGLKDMANKILPSLLAQAIKLCMIQLCMYFCLNIFLGVSIKSITEPEAMDIKQFFYIVFTMLLTLALCSNAPKLATTMLTGNPQMSMGEFVAAAGAAIGGAKLAGKAMDTASSGISNTARTIANGGATTLGNMGAIFAAGKAGADANGNPAGFSVRSAASEAGHQMKRNLLGGVSNWMHGSSPSGNKTPGSRWNSGSQGVKSSLSYTSDAASRKDDAEAHNKDFKNALHYEPKKDSAGNLTGGGSYTGRASFGEYMSMRQNDAAERARERAKRRRKLVSPEG